MGAEVVWSESVVGRRGRELGEGPGKGLLVAVMEEQPAGHLGIDELQPPPVVQLQCVWWNRFVQAFNLIACVQM